MPKLLSFFEPRTLARAILLALVCAAPAAAVDLKLERRAPVADKVRVCVVMDSKGVDVAGTQNDLKFSPSCAALVQEDCVASAHHGKPLHGSIPTNEPSTFRSLVFALDNVDPMADGEVYCCNFTLKNDGDGCCPVEMGRLGASDPQGVALEVTAMPERVCLASDAPPPADAVVFEEVPDATPASSSPSWLWVAIFAAVVLAVLFFALRKSS